MEWGEGVWGIDWVAGEVNAEWDGREEMEGDGRGEEGGEGGGVT